MSVDPLALVYAGIEVYKIYRDDVRFDADMAALRAKNLDAAGMLDELHKMRQTAADAAHKAVDGMAS